MRLVAPDNLTHDERLAYYEVPENIQFYQYGTQGGWEKYEQNPVLGEPYGTCFDMSVVKDGDIFKMWFSWRPQKGIAYCESMDGIKWSEPLLVLPAIPDSQWEAGEVNRPCVIKEKGIYRMWYSGQVSPYQPGGVSVICYAESTDGIAWSRFPEPVLAHSQEWENHAIMCPHVLYDEEEGIYKMWYSAGDNHEPHSIGYAISLDGLDWKVNSGNPILSKNPDNLWEQHKVVASHVIKLDGYYYMFYVGHFHEERGSIGLARSKNGMTDWEPHPQNPLISTSATTGAWDSLSIYKPYVLRDHDKWIMWYNGAAFDSKAWVLEQIGVVYLRQDGFGF
jgi:beta-xylosidase